MSNTEQERGENINGSFYAELPMVLPKMFYLPKNKNKPTEAMYTEKLFVSWRRNRRSFKEIKFLYKLKKCVYLERNDRIFGEEIKTECYRR